MIEDFRLIVYLTVVSRSNFTLAAKELGITQPAVSKHICELESQLGTTLIDRGRGGTMRVTEAGRLFEGYARQIIHWYRAAEEAFKGGHLPDPPVRIKMGDGREAEFWASQGDIHINIK